MDVSSDGEILLGDGDIAEIDEAARPGTALPGVPDRRGIRKA